MGLHDAPLKGLQGQLFDRINVEVYRASGNLLERYGLVGRGEAPIDLIGVVLLNFLLALLPPQLVLLVSALLLLFPLVEAPGLFIEAELGEEQQELRSVDGAVPVLVEVLDDGPRLSRSQRDAKGPKDHVPEKRRVHGRPLECLKAHGRGAHFIVVRRGGRDLRHGRVPVLLAHAPDSNLLRLLCLLLVLPLLVPVGLLLSLPRFELLPLSESVPFFLETHLGELHQELGAVDCAVSVLIELVHKRAHLRRSEVDLEDGAAEIMEGLGRHLGTLEACQVQGGGRSRIVICRFVRKRVKGVPKVLGGVLEREGVV
mmetsp:Transcript_21041/g.39409  ORF Transcript_21041/g.39409 Transcript_21041/m.39409 type:complete len:314 (-) Transcript_21041:1197-2138(-)